MTTLRSAAQQALEFVTSEVWGTMPYMDVRVYEDAAKLRDALKAALAEPQEPDSPERRCGGPGCDMKCCQPVQEPVAWMTVRLNVPIQTTARKDVADEWLKWGEVLPLYAAPPQRPAEPLQEPVAIVGTQADTWKGHEGQWLPPGPPIKTVHMLRELPEGTLLYTAPPPRLPLTEEEISEIASRLEQQGNTMRQFARAIERAHKIGGEG